MLAEIRLTEEGPGRAVCVTASPGGNFGEPASSPTGVGHDGAMTAPSTANPPRHTRHWLVVAGAACMSIAGQFVFLSSSILNPPMAQGLGVGLSEVMIYNSLMAVSGVVSMTFIAPWLYRRLGVRWSVVTGGIFVAATLGGVALVANVAALYVLGFATGLMFGVVTTMAASMLVNTWFEASRGTVMGAVFAASGLGGISAGLVLPALVAASGWQAGFASLGALVLLLIVLPGVLLVRSRPEDVGLRPFGAQAAPAASGTTEVRLPGVPARRAFRTPQFAALAVAIALVGAVIAVQMHFVPLLAERGVTVAVAGSLLSLMALASVFTNIMLGTLNDRRGTLTATLVALACLAASLVAYVFSVGFVPLAVSTVLFAVGIALPGVLVPIMVMQMFGMRDYATILGPVMAMLPAGVSVATPLWAVAVDITGSYTIALAVAAAATVASGLLLLWAIPSARGLRDRVERELGQSYGEA